MYSVQTQHLQLNDEIVQDIHQSVQTTLSSIFGFQPLPKPHRVEWPASTIGEKVRGDISGFVSLVQDEVEATMIVSFKKEAVFTMVNKAFNKNITQIDSLACSAVGEIANVVYGIVKTNLNKRGFSFKATIPNVVLGQYHSIVSLSSGPTMVLPFTLGDSEFHVLLTLHPDMKISQSA